MSADGLVIDQWTGKSGVLCTSVTWTEVEGGRPGACSREPGFWRMQVAEWGGKPSAALVSGLPRGPADKQSCHLPLGGDALGIPEPAAVLIWWRDKHTQAECDLKYEQGHVTKESRVVQTAFLGLQNKKQGESEKQDKAGLMGPEPLGSQFVGREKRSGWITGALRCVFHIERISQAGMGFPAFPLQELCVN